MIIRDINHCPNNVVVKTCFACGYDFQRFEIQEAPIEMCFECSNSAKSYDLVKITTVFNEIKKIIKLSESKKVSINNKDAIYIEDLLLCLQNK
jgi:hypothetical protein